jgi:mRNA interferase RelE/StbE
MLVQRLKVLFTKKAGKFITSLQKGYIKKLKEIIKHLRINPFSYPYKKIRGETHIYRIRIGKYRILYEVDDSENTITILKVSTRESIYNHS